MYFLGILSQDTFILGKKKLVPTQHEIFKRN